MYTTTVNNYRGLTTGGMSVDCPHRERRGYGEEKRREEPTLYAAVLLCGVLSVYCILYTVYCMLYAVVLLRCCAVWYCMLI